MKSKLIAPIISLVLFLVPVLVWGQGSGEGYVTVWFDDFLDDPGDPREERNDSLWAGAAYMRYDEHDGFYFLRGTLGPPGLDGPRALYEGFEVRLRLNHTNRKKVVKSWGFGYPFVWRPNEGGPFSQSALIFAYYPPEADPLYQGFWAESHVNGVYTLRKNLTNIDITEWHTYTVLWEPNEATFLIDWEVVATTDIAPNRPRPLQIRNRELPVPRCEGHLAPIYNRTPEAEWFWDGSYQIQIDYVHVFITKGILEEIYSRAGEMIAEMRDLLPPEKEHNVTVAFTRASEAWMNQDYNSTWTHLWQVIWTCEMPEFIQQAENTLRSMENIGYDITNAKDYYEEAMQEWWSELPHGYSLYSLTYDLSCIIAWHDIHYYNLFARAREDIEAAQDRGEQTQRLECYYSAAQSYWGDGDPPPPADGLHWTAKMAKNYLDMIPEPALLPLLSILGLVLLPAMLGRWRD